MAPIHIMNCESSRYMSGKDKTFKVMAKTPDALDN